MELLLTMQVIQFNSIQKKVIKLWSYLTSFVLTAAATIAAFCKHHQWYMCLNTCVVLCFCYFSTYLTFVYFSYILFFFFFSFSQYISVKLTCIVLYVFAAGQNSISFEFTTTRTVIYIKSNYIKHSVHNNSLLTQKKL